MLSFSNHSPPVKRRGVRLRAAERLEPANSKATLNRRGELPGNGAARALRDAPLRPDPSAILALLAGSARTTDLKSIFGRSEVTNRVDIEGHAQNLTNSSSGNQP